MSTDIERLIVSLEASTTKYENALKRANAETDKRVRSMQARFDGLGSGIARTESKIAGSMGNVVRAFGALGIALTTANILAMTSAWTDLNSRINNAAGGVERGTAVLDRLSEMARRTYSSLTQTAEGYLQNQQALSALGYSTQQQLDLVEALNNSLVISATRGQSAQSVMDAWSKAMASGSLRGENLNTIIQKGGRLSKALADSMGISVNELRRMGEQGKITTDVMYGVTSQLETLRDEAERMPATVSDGFVLLNNAVFKFIGQADEAVGSSNALATALIEIADAIDRAPDEPWFDRMFGDLGDEVAKTVNATYRELVAIGTALDYIANTNPGQALSDLAALGEGDSTKGIEDFELALADAEQAVVNLAVNTKGKFGEVDAAAQDLFAQILRGRGSVENAHAAVEALASVNPEFAGLKAGVLAVIDTFYAMRDAANAARQAADTTTTELGSFPSRRAFQSDFGVDLSGDGTPGGPTLPPRPGGSGKSPAQRYQEDLTQYARKIEMLKQETALTASLNPLLNDYGFAKERLKAIQELENAATKAGITLDKAKRDEIETLATGYANATVEAAKLAEAQDKAKAAADELQQAGQRAVDTLIDGLLEGKNAGELLQSVVKDLAKDLIKMGIKGMLGGGGFNPLSLLTGAPGFATGTANTGGQRGQARGIVHGQEAVIPLPNGGRVPVDLRMPAIPQLGGGGQQGVHVTVGVSADSAGNLTPYVESVAQQAVSRAAPGIVGASVRQTRKLVPKWQPQMQRTGA